MNTVAIRGAITVENNNSNDILCNTVELIKEIERRNNINKSQVIAIIFSSTTDLNVEYPAKAARELGYLNTALMCFILLAGFFAQSFNEMNVVGNLSKCIRLMMLYNTEISQDRIKHVYLKGAKILRPDLDIS